MLKDIKTPVATAKKSKSEMPSVVIDTKVNVVTPDGIVKEAQLLTEFNKARAAFKAAEAQVKDLEPQVKKAGVREWIKANVANSPREVVTSIKLIDANGSETRLTGMDKYPMADSTPLAALFEDDGPLSKTNGDEPTDINDYVQFTLRASFNSKVFLNNAGDFDEKIYLLFKKAIDDVAAKLKVPSPIDAVKVLQPKPDFHQKRWGLFNVVQQVQLFDVLPNQVTLTPLVVNEPVVSAVEAPHQPQ